MIKKCPVKNIWAVKTDGDYIATLIYIHMALYTKLNIPWLGINRPNID